MGIIENIRGIFKKRFEYNGSVFVVENSYLPSYWHREDYYKAYENIGYVNQCIAVRAETIGNIQLKTLYRMDSTKEWKEYDRHPILKLLRNPNEDMSQYNLFQTLESYILIQGEAFLYMELGEKTGTPKRLFFLDPRYMTVISNSNASNLADKFQILGYRYKDDKGYSVMLDKNEIIHFKKPHPRNLLRGVGPTQAGYTYIKTEEYSSSWTANYIYNNATPAGVLSFKGQISKEQFKELKKRYNSEYGGIKNAGKTLIVNNAETKFEKIGTSLSEVNLKELRNMTRDDIMFMYRIPKSILGISDDVNRANAEASEYIYYSHTIQPEINFIIDTFEKQLMPMWKYKGEFRLESNNVIPENEELKYKMLQSADWLTDNEKREMSGKEIINDPSADMLYKPAGLLPTAQYKPKTKSIIFTKSIKEEIMPASKITVTKAESNWRQMITINSKYEDNIQKEMKDLFNQQKDEVISNLMKEKSITKNGIKTKVDKIMNRKKWEERFAQTMEKNYIGIIREQGERSGALAQIKSFNPNSEKIRRYITSKVAQFATEVNQSTRDELVKLFTESVESGLAIPEIAKEVLNIYEVADKVRAEMIARTETMRAAGFATREAYDQSPNVEAYEWYTATDERTCEFCSEMHGKVIDKGTDFFEKDDILTGINGGILNLNYEDIDHPPLHPQCRCDLLPVVSKD